MLRAEELNTLRELAAYSRAEVTTTFSAVELNTLRELARREATMTDTRGNIFCASCLTPLLDYIGELTADRDKWKERVRQLCLEPKN